MSKSLNSDYLSQLYIKADTKSMDKALAKPGLASSGLPDEAKALVVYKRGYVNMLFAGLRSHDQRTVLGFVSVRCVAKLKDSLLEPGTNVILYAHLYRPSLCWLQTRVLSFHKLGCSVLM